MQWLTEETGWILPEEDDLFDAAYHAPEKLMALGAGLAHAAARIIVGCADSDAAKAAAMILCGAIASAGGAVCFAPSAIPAALQTGAALHHCGILVHCGAYRMTALSRGMLPLTEAQTAQIRSGMQNYRQMQHSECGEILHDRALNGIYAAQLRRKLPAHLNVNADIETASPLLDSVLQTVFSGGSGEHIILRLSADGRRASVYTEPMGWIFYEKLLMMCCQRRLMAGEDAALPCWLPHIAEDMAMRCGQKILRYAAQPDGRDTEARQLAALQGFTLDGAALCADILRIRAENGLSLQAWAESLPPCYTVRRIVRTNTAAEDAVRNAPALRARQEADGLRVQTAQGQALLHPSRDGRAVSLLAEGNSMEAASELAGDIVSLLAGIHPALP